MADESIGPGKVVAFHYDLYETGPETEARTGAEPGADTATGTATGTETNAAAEASPGATTGAETGARMIESSRRGHPVRFLFGESGVLAALQDAFRGRAAGEEFSVAIPHQRAYGRRYPDRVRRVPRKTLDGGKGRTFRPGQPITLRGERGPISATVLKAGKFNVDVDANHPLAGRDLRFDVRVVEVRPASDDERAHGHAHGPGGHEHG